MKVYKKLVRDKIPQIIQANGEKPVIRTLDDRDYLAELVKKLKEEVAEFEADMSVEELADIKEVLIAIRETLGIKAGDLEDIRRQKADKNGRFKKRIFLETVNE